MSKTLFKNRLCPSEDGLMIITEMWACIHETPSYWYCVPETYKNSVIRMAEYDGTTPLRAAKALNGPTLKRVHKQNSRFAFETEQKALEHLQLLKRKQLAHLKRDIRFLEAFLDTPDEKLKKDNNAERMGIKHVVLRHTKDLVREYYIYE